MGVMQILEHLENICQKKTPPNVAYATVQLAVSPDICVASLLGSFNWMTLIVQETHPAFTDV